MIKISKEANPNYLCKIVTLDKLRKHSNANRLQIATIDFQDVVTGLDAKEGDVYVYFPVEGKINKDFLSYTNSFRKKELNQDPEKSGFFEENCRVKAVKLRSERSMGYIVPSVQVSTWAGVDIFPEDVGKEFDIIGREKLVEKYEIKRNEPRTKSGKGPTRTSKIIDGQFKFHQDTSNFRKTITTYNDNDKVAVSYKLHGTSIILANILVKKSLNWFERALKAIGVNIVDKIYDLVYSSRRVIKNEYLENEKRHNHFYSTDIWGLAAEKYKDSIPKGFTLYAEIVGQLPDGQWIQKNYDYGCKDCQFEMYVYRITFTNEDGQSFELSTDQMLEFCFKQNLKTPDVFFIGTFKELKEELKVTDDRDVISKLEEKYNNKHCYMCNNKVPEEGIVIKKESLINFEASKLKSFDFLTLESKELDSGEIDMESEN